MSAYACRVLSSLSRRAAGESSRNSVSKSPSIQIPETEKAAELPLLHHGNFVERSARLRPYHSLWKRVFPLRKQTKMETDGQGSGDIVEGVKKFLAGEVTPKPSPIPFEDRRVSISLRLYGPADLAPKLEQFICGEIEGVVEKACHKFSDDNKVDVSWSVVADRKPNPAP